MTPIVYSKDLGRRCSKEEIAYLEKSIREMVDEMEVKNSPVFVPWPANEEDMEACKDWKVPITFFPIRPKKLDRMVMIIPLFIKENNCNIWYVQMKDAEMILDIRTTLVEGHHRS